MKKLDYIKSGIGKDGQFKNLTKAVNQRSFLKSNYKDDDESE